MRGKRLKVLMIIAVVLLIAFGSWLGQHLRERHKAAEREVQYQTLLAKYTSELKPGMSREQVISPLSSTPSHKASDPKRIAQTSSRECLFFIVSKGVYDHCRNIPVTLNDRRSKRAKSQLTYTNARERTE